MGAKLLIDAAQKSCDESGDGTTTCTVIANKVLEQGLIAVHANPTSAIEIRKQI